MGGGVVGWIPGLYSFEENTATETMTDSDYADDLALLTDTSIQAESLWYSLDKAAEGIGLYVNPNKTEFMRFKQDGAISTRKVFKINRPIHIPWQQYLINWNWY